MSILIKGMGMPKNCDECFFVGRGFPDWCSLPQIPKDEDEIDDTNNRPDWCPLEALPSAQPETHDKRTETHACDLISRQATIDACIRVQEHHAYDEIEEIKALPSAQPEPSMEECACCVLINPERKKGRWIEHNPHKWGLGIVFECSECGEKIDCEPSNFCPNCGAEMREPEDIPMEYFESGGR